LGVHIPHVCPAFHVLVKQGPTESGRILAFGGGRVSEEDGGRAYGSRTEGVFFWYVTRCIEKEKKERWDVLVNEKV
jgi:hypothetical protein